MTFNLYLVRKFVFLTALLAFVILGLVFLAELSEVNRQYGDRGEISSIALISLSRLPWIWERAGFVFVFFSGVFCAYQMEARNELSVAYATGINVTQFIKVLFLTGLVFGLCDQTLLRILQNKIVSMSNLTRIELNARGVASRSNELTATTFEITDGRIFQIVAKQFIQSEKTYLDVDYSIVDRFGHTENTGAVARIKITNDEIQLYSVDNRQSDSSSNLNESSKADSSFHEQNFSEQLVESFKFLTQSRSRNLMIAEEAMGLHDYLSILYSNPTDVIYSSALRYQMLNALIQPWLFAISAPLGFLFIHQVSRRKVHRFVFVYGLLFGLLIYSWQSVAVDLYFGGLANEYFATISTSLLLGSALIWLWVRRWIV